MTNSKTSGVEVLVQVSDLHCGSIVGLAPPVTKTSSGNKITFGDNICQQWLWQNWVKGAQEVKKIIGKSHAALLINGDATEGVHHRNEPEILAAKIETHVEMARECLKEYSFCKTRFVVKGTECHTKDMEELLAERIGAVESTAKDTWLIRINGCLVNAAHHMPTTGRAYLEAGPLSICMGNARLNSIRAGHEVPKVFGRGHRHCGGFYTDGFGTYGVTSAWQFLTRHGKKVVTDSIPIPSILIHDFRGIKHGQLPITRELKFNPPQDSITEV